MAGTIIQERRYREFRDEMKDAWQRVNAACALCGQATIDWDGPPNERDSFEMDHRISRKKRPDLAMDPGNVQPSHHRCNRGKGAGDAGPTLGETTETW